MKSCSYSSTYIALVYIALLLFSCAPNTEPASDSQKPTYAKEEAKDPLPSWNDSESKKAILDYMAAVTEEGSAHFIPLSQRITTFDNDGTLWSEQPIYFQLFFAMDRVKAMAANHPEWENEPAFKAVLENDMEALTKTGMEGISELVMATHAGNTTEEFDAIVKEWVATAKHPTKNKGYDELVYQPMLELLQFLRANDFKTFIVSGGGVDFMRAFVTEVYGIPSEQIIGTRIKTAYDYNDGNPVIRRQAGLDFFDDKEGKPVNIQRIIGKKPVLAGGNSDGDLQMLQWTDSNEYESLQIYVHHTDSVREWAYDRASHIGGFDKGLDEALEKGWTIVDMEKDWKVIYPFELD